MKRRQFIFVNKTVTIGINPVKMFGQFSCSFGAGAFVVGSLLGGYFISRFGVKRVILILCLIFNIPDAVYAFLAFRLPTNFAVICGSIMLEWFGYGFGFVGVILFFELITFQTVTSKQTAGNSRR